jgi:hypothetical protein
MRQISLSIFSTTVNKTKPRSIYYKSINAGNPPLAQAPSEPLDAINPACRAGSLTGCSPLPVTFAVASIQ